MKKKRIEVAVRMRPIIFEYEDSSSWQISQTACKISSLSRSQTLKNNSISQDGSNAQKKRNRVEQSNSYEFGFDYVFNEERENKQIYDSCCCNIISDFLAGNHGTIFMYGQTTSGKTYTMLGNDRTAGIITYSLRNIFNKNKSSFTISISYMQIYNEQINDLLNEGGSNLKIIDSDVHGLIEEKVDSIEEAVQILTFGQNQRSYSEKRYHDHSSRSHTIFQIKIHENSKVKAILNLVDLSGSQRLNDDEVTEETAYINKSLFTLSNVMYKLANNKNGHIPYRDSKLTRLLAPALTSSRNTLIICTISPAEVNFSQTLSTLRFATQSRKIQLKSKGQISSDFSSQKRKIIQLEEKNSFLMKSLAFEKQNQQHFLERKVKILEEKLQIPFPKKNLWQQKTRNLCRQYEKNIQILQKQYTKALINLTSTDLSIEKAFITSQINQTEQTLN